MRKTGCVVIVLLVSAAAAGYFLLPWRTWSAQAISDFRVEREGSAWPADQAWTWTFHVPKELRDNRAVQLSVRSSTTILPPGILRTSSATNSAMPAAEADREFDTGAVSHISEPLPRTGKATIQFLDLRKIGAVSATPGQDLRVLGKLSIGGMQQDLDSERFELPPGGRFQGWTMSSYGRWANDELYLMTFYVEKDRELTRYDVFLESVPDPLRASR